MAVSAKPAEIALRVVFSIMIDVMDDEDTNINDFTFIADRSDIFV